MSEELNDLTRRLYAQGTPGIAIRWGDWHNFTIALLIPEDQRGLFDAVIAQSKLSVWDANELKQRYLTPQEQQAEQDAKETAEAEQMIFTATGRSRPATGISAKSWTPCGTTPACWKWCVLPGTCRASTGPSMNSMQISCGKSRISFKAGSAMTMMPPWNGAGKSRAKAAQ